MSMASPEQMLTARMMLHLWGRWAVGIAGAVVIGVGAALVYEGLARKFEKRLKSFKMTPTQRKGVVGLGVVGTSARGLVFGLVGLLLIRAAVDFDPQKGAVWTARCVRSPRLMPGRGCCTPQRRGFSSSVSP